MDDLHLSRAFEGWGDCLSKQVKLVQDDLIRPNKYFKYEWASLKNISALRKNMTNDYSKYWKELESKKDKLLKEAIPGKWNLDSMVRHEISDEE